MNTNDPMYKLFLCFVLDTINELPNEQLMLIQSMNLKKVFQSEEEGWKEIIKSSLKLSDTIEIAIQDLWLKNSKIAFEKEIKFSPSEFASFFIENYYQEGSKIDVWENEEEIEIAKKNILNSYLRE